MNGAVILGLLLAQTQPAPAPTAAPAPAPAAPVAPAPPPASSPTADPGNRVGVLACFAFRLSPGGNQLAPMAGFSVGGEYQRRYYRLSSEPGPWLDFAVGVSFFHDRFSMPVNGVEDPVRSDRVISQTGFVASQVISMPIAPVRLWAAGGAGLTVGFFSSPEADLAPGSKKTLQPLLAGAVGFALTFDPNTEIGLRAQLMHPLTQPTFVPTSGPPLALFGDLLDIGVELSYRF